MLILMDKYAIIKLKREGLSNRKVAELLSINRKTVARYWNKYGEQLELLNSDCVDMKSIQEEICSAPSYDVSGRMARKYTKEMEMFLEEILENESEKIKILGRNKQQLTQTQIHELFMQKGYDISLSTISNKVRDKRNAIKECFIRQEYALGTRMEYDFGEVKLAINGVVSTYYLAVISSPASGFRWAFLYKNQKKDVFLDSHVRFFEMCEGVYREAVYDNMRNVVTRFIGKNEKELNEDLVKLSIYYGFDINVTNCFKGNEKGHVESSVKIIRNKVFANHYKFKTFEDASAFLQQELVILNKDSKFKEEKSHLLPYKPKLELAKITTAKVNMYSFISIENNFYSVPEYLVGRDVTVKIYCDNIVIYSNLHMVCNHKKIDGANEISIDIMHYLNTLAKKPGALRNSYALKSLPKLKSIYDNNFSTNPKGFIDIIREHADKEIDEIIDVLAPYSSSNIVSISISNSKLDIGSVTREQTSKYNNLCVKGGAAL